MTVPVPDLDAGLRYYGQALGHRLIWRNDAVGHAGLAGRRWPGSATWLSCTDRAPYVPRDQPRDKVPPSPLWRVVAR